MKVAIALFVKNEQQDITSWIAWHIALGVDKLFIFDDHSTDGTYEIIQAAATIYNIELYQTNPNEITYFDVRQKDSYLKSCKMAEEQDFDWIACIDGDEFISLEENQTIQEFLNKFSDCNAIALNWKIYGSSERVFKTKLATYEAYTYHCDKSLGDCALVKSFIKPSEYTYNYTDPHRFQMKNEKYVDALGNTFQWNGAAKKILWKGAHINHYICRSMEHYIQRVKRRVNADISDSTSNWQHFNRNDIYSPENPKLIAQSNLILNTIKKTCIEQFIKRNIDQTSVFIHSNSNVKIVSFETANNTIPGLLKHEDFLTQYNQSDSFFKIFGVIYMSNPHFIYLFYIKDNQISNILFLVHDEQNNTSSYVYSLEDMSSSNVYSLKSLTTNKYVSFEPRTYARIVVNRDEPKEWEQVTLHKEIINIDFCCCPEIITSKEMFIAFLQKYQNQITYADFILAFNQLNVKQRQEVINTYPNGQLLNWI